MSQGQIPDHGPGTGHPTAVLRRRASDLRGDTTVRSDSLAPESVPPRRESQQVPVASIVS